MGTTPTYGLPYPEATDFVTDGAAAIQALAEETETELAAAASAASAAYAPRVAAGAKGYRSTQQLIPTATATALLFDAESFDTDAFHDLATNTDRFTVPAGMDGLYRLTAGVVFSHHATGRRALDITVTNSGSGIRYVAEDNKTGAAGDSGSGLALVAVTDEPLVAGDYVRALVEQGSGANLACGGNRLTFLSVVRIGA